MQTIIIVSGIIISIFAIVYIFNKVNLEERRKILRFAYGDKEGFNYDTHFYDHVDNYFNGKVPTRFVDSQSMKDLDLMKVYHRINRAQSSIGDEYLYARLRNQDRMKNTELFEGELKKYNDNEKLRVNHQLAFQKLGKHKKNDLFNFISQKGDYPMTKTIRHQVQGILAVLALVIVPVNLPVGISAVTLMFIVNELTFFAMKEESTQRFLVLKNYANMISVAKNIQGEEDSIEFDKALKKLNKVTFYSSFLADNTSMDVTGFGMITQHLSAYFMTHILAYNKILEISQNNQENSLIIYETIGYKEMCISVASYRKSLTYFSLPKFSGSASLSFTELYHPLISNPVSYTNHVEEKLLITGSNASGKSTFVKSIALNTILSKVINTSLGKEFNLKPYFVQTSMAISDNVESGDSYFIAEIKSIKKLLETTQKEPHSMIVIDEVLKGTNTIERIAASSAVLNYLSKSKSFICAASHDIELTKILEGRYVNYHFRETIEEDGITFDYQLHKGPSKTKNAIRLLDVLKYPEEIIKEAKSLAKNFEETNQWETSI